MKCAVLWSGCWFLAQYCSVEAFGPRTTTISPDVTLASLRKEKILRYNMAEYPLQAEFRAVLTRMLGLDSEASLPDLSQLHLLEKCVQEELDGSKNRINAIQLKWNLGRDRDGAFDAFQSFQKTYRRFVRDFIGPRLGGGRIIFQVYSLLTAFFLPPLSVHVLARARAESESSL